MKYKLINWVLFILAIAFVGNLIRTIASLSSEENIIKDAKEKLSAAIDENQNLKRKLSQTESQEFIEREARNKLNLGKEGEIVLILPSISPFITPTPIPPDISPNWQKWVKLFF